MERSQVQVLLPMKVGIAQMVARFIKKRSYRLLPSGYVIVNNGVVEKSYFVSRVRVPSLSGSNNGRCSSELVEQRMDKRSFRLLPVIYSSLIFKQCRGTGILRFLMCRGFESRSARPRHGAVAQVGRAIALFIFCLFNDHLPK